ncbi:hypothetical protein [Deinococcus pimensis]|uniref:hypothetical protein n=1 Tax=Deinococcus pimensis TaxID=309888 RepID=UPI0012F92549|nr:hypothetical protein [Deinococcus pimensis]
MKDFACEPVGGVDVDVEDEDSLEEAVDGCTAEVGADAGEGDLVLVVGDVDLDLVGPAGHDPVAEGGEHVNLLRGKGTRSVVSACEAALIRTAEGAWSV